VDVRSDQGFVSDVKRFGFVAYRSERVGHARAQESLLQCPVSTRRVKIFWCIFVSDQRYFVTSFTKWDNSCDRYSASQSALRTCICVLIAYHKRKLVKDTHYLRAFRVHWPCLEHSHAPSAFMTRQIAPIAQISIPAICFERQSICVNVDTHCMPLISRSYLGSILAYNA
jgi:hypothetical protein